MFALCAAKQSLLITISWDEESQELLLSLRRAPLVGVNTLVSCNVAAARGSNEDAEQHLRWARVDEHADECAEHAFIYHANLSLWFHALTPFSMCRSQLCW